MKPATEETRADEVLKGDLSSLKKKNLRKDKNRLSQVPFGMLKDILTYKAPLSGKVVKTVDPSFTSQKDSRGLSGGERKGCRFYTSDGLVFDAVDCPIT
jgi:IS605 OrfB family transposase